MRRRCCLTRSLTGPLGSAPDRPPRARASFSTETQGSAARGARSRHTSAEYARSSRHDTRGPRNLAVSMGQPRRFPGFAAHPSGQVSQVQGTQRQRAHRLGTLMADCFLAVLEAGEAGIKVPAASVTAGDTRAGFTQRPLRCAHTASPRWCRGRRPLLLGHKATASHGAYACTRAHTQTLIPS